LKIIALKQKIEAAKREAVIKRLDDLNGMIKAMEERIVCTFDTATNYANINADRRFKREMRRLHLQHGAKDRLKKAFEATLVNYFKN
jgi:hypothetical protein